MKVLPRHSWTAKIPRTNEGIDKFTGLSTARRPIGIDFITSEWEFNHQEQNPVEIFQSHFESAIALGYSDIHYNLGVSGNVDGVWNLRGLTNKSSYSPFADNNDSFLTVFVALGRNEKPNDRLLRNIVEARWLVLSRHLQATKILEYNGNPYLEAILQRNLWEQKGTPVEIYLPEAPLYPQTLGVAVWELQEALASGGYYRKRVTGRFNIQTEDALVELKADLLDGGLYHGELDGVYDDRIRQAWTKSLET